MSKKKVSLEAIDNFLGDQEEKEPVQTTTTEKRAQRGRPREEDYEARTFRVRKDLVQKLRIIATLEGRLQKDILDFALENIITRYEQKHGKIDISRAYARKDALTEIF